MMEVLALQSAQAGSYLSTGLFLMGILGLLFILRKTLMARMRRKRSRPRLARFNVDGRSAREIIREIDEANLVARSKKAMVFSRSAPELTVEQLEHLDRIDNWQRQHRSHREK